MDPLEVFHHEERPGVGPEVLHEVRLEVDPGAVRAGAEVAPKRRVETI